MDLFLLCLHLHLEHPSDLAIQLNLLIQANHLFQWSLEVQVPLFLLLNLKNLLVLENLVFLEYLVHLLVQVDPSQTKIKCQFFISFVRDSCYQHIH